MTKFDCEDHIAGCAAKSLLHEVAMMGADTTLDTERDEWFDLLDAAELSGDEIADYDGALTSVSTASVCF